MIVLVDYDNVEHQHRRSGPAYLVERILTALGIPYLASDPNVLFRLYGGWYGTNTPTRIAQTLASSLPSAFPRRITLVDGHQRLTTVADCELAYSIMADPGRHLWHTYRQRGCPRKLRSRHPNAAGCRNPHCPVAVLTQFVATGVCPEPGCAVKPEDVFYRGEQKLVDSMMTADIVYLANRGEPRTAIVTSDDDSWPGIRTAMILGAEVCQIHTKAGYATKLCYSSGLAGHYLQGSL